MFSKILLSLALTAVLVSHIHLAAAERTHSEERMHSAELTHSGERMHSAERTHADEARMHRMHRAHDSSQKLLQV